MLNGSRSDKYMDYDEITFSEAVRDVFCEDPVREVERESFEAIIQTRNSYEV